MRILHLVSCRGWSSDAYWAARVARELERLGHDVTLGCRAGTERRVIDRARLEGVSRTTTFGFGSGFKPRADIHDVRRLARTLATTDVVLVATITVRRAELEAFRAFERHAARVMASHGGRIERAIVVQGEGETLREVHLVRFPDEAAFAAYRDDPELASALPLRDRSVVATEVLRGEDGPDYSAATGDPTAS